MPFRAYAHYTLTEFLEDDSFIQWVIDPDTKSNSFWQSFLISHPEKEDVVREASSVILVYRKQVMFTNEERREAVWKRINTSVPKQVSSNTKVFSIATTLKIAASLALLIACGILIWMSGNYSRTIT